MVPLTANAGAEEPSVACTVKPNAPATLGLPLRTPEALSAKPAGRDPLATDHV